MSHSASAGVDLYAQRAQPDTGRLAYSSGHLSIASPILPGEPAVRIVLPFVCCIVRPHPGTILSFVDLSYSHCKMAPPSYLQPLQSTNVARMRRTGSGGSSSSSPSTRDHGDFSASDRSGSLSVGLGGSPKVDNNGLMEL